VQPEATELISKRAEQSQQMINNEIQDAITNVEDIINTASPAV
jgi:hypothetical protein